MTEARLAGTEPLLKYHEHVGACPACNVDIVFAEFCDPFTCPSCGVSLDSDHVCYWNEETGDAWCCDCLIRAESL